MCAYLSDFLDSNLFQIIKCFVIERRKPGCIIGYSLRNIDYEALACARQKNSIGICQIFDIVFASDPGPIGRRQTITHLVVGPSAIFNSEIRIPSNNGVIQFQALRFKLTGNRLKKIAGPDLNQRPPGYELNGC